MRDKISLPILALLFLIILLQPLFADYITRTRKVSINWSKGRIISRGSSSIKIEPHGSPIDYHNNSSTSINRARADAYTLAREEAIVNIYEAIKEIRIDVGNTVRDLIKDNKYIQTRLSALIEYSISENEYPVDFFTTQCEIKLRMSDIIASIPFDFPFQNFPLRDDTPISTYYSGLIVDGRGLNIKPMLFPSIYNDNGLEIYGRYYIKSQFACNFGMVSYCYSEEEAFNDKRAGKNPYFTVALKEIKGCPVLSDKDARRIFSDKETINNLAECRVIFILDRG
ncbi:MAG: hypothetical protein SVZ03_02890 [Spirochaetota bacterium]|nr:hypothetical protein [Spirochaetota bacterium]